MRTQPTQATQQAVEATEETEDRDAVRIGVLTSGGDAQGMNAAVRAVVRTGIHLGAQVYAVREGYEGAVAGGDGITRMGWEDVGNILHRGGTVIGTARSKRFRDRAGRLDAAENLLAHGIDRLVVIGGDGSLTGTDTFRTEWPGLLAELVETGRLEADVAAAHPVLHVAGLVGSIDNDLVGSDMTIGADSALHRIVEAIDAIASTAASHQRTFVVEVMGRHCGYLPLFAAIAGDADAALIPENPPEVDWATGLCERVVAGREAGRRESIVLVAEGARDAAGAPITVAQVRDALEERLGVDARVTILGHVQRGGTPSAYDRWMSTLLGYAAVQEVLGATDDTEAHILGVRHNRIAQIPLAKAVAATKALAEDVDSGQFAQAAAARGDSFTQAIEVFRTFAHPPTQPPAPDAKRVAILHVGGLAPGMNTAAQALVRLGAARGWRMLGVRGGVPGLIAGDVGELTWGDVEGWGREGGAELGTRRVVPDDRQLYALARSIEAHDIDALLFVGGFNAYRTAFRLHAERERYPAFDLPVVCVPTSIDNNLPGSELSIGADTALNDAVRALDGIKQSASAATRCFVAETMGRRCGYLALLAGIACGAERVYLPEDGITLADLADDVERMREAFTGGKRLFLAVRGERASEHYTTDLLARIFEEEGRGLYDVRTAVLGHLQQGGSPSPFDRILAVRLAHDAVAELARQFESGRARSRFVGLLEGREHVGDIDRMPDVVDLANRRPFDQWWLQLRPVIPAVSDPTARTPEEATVPVLRADVG